MQCKKYFIFIILSFYFTFILGKINIKEHVSDIDNVTHTLNTPASVEKVPEETELPCKEESVRRDGDTPTYSMHNETLNFVTLKRDSTGQRTYFGLRFAIEAGGDVYIWLSEKEDYSGIRCTLYIGLNSNQYTRLYCNADQVQYIKTPDILSSTHFRAFYFKIDDGKLQFGKEVDIRPLISYSDVNLGSLNYYGFSSYYGAKIRYCPAQGSS